MRCSYWHRRTAAAAAADTASRALPWAKMHACACALWCPRRNATAADFHEIDVDGKGMVMLTEFCEWIESIEMVAGTEIGQELHIGE